MRSAESVTLVSQPWSFSSFTPSVVQSHQYGRPPQLFSGFQDHRCDFASQMGCKGKSMLLSNFRRSLVYYTSLNFLWSWFWFRINLHSIIKQPLTKLLPILITWFFTIWEVERNPDASKPSLRYCVSRTSPHKSLNYVNMNVQSNLVSVTHKFLMFAITSSEGRLLQLH